MSATQIHEKFKNLQNKSNVVTKPNQHQPKNDMQRFDIANQNNFQLKKKNNKDVNKQISDIQKEIFQSKKLKLNFGAAQSPRPQETIKLSLNNSDRRMQRNEALYASQ